MKMTQLNPSIGYYMSLCRVNGVELTINGEYLTFYKRSGIFCYHKEYRFNIEFNDISDMIEDFAEEASKYLKEQEKLFNEREEIRGIKAWKIM